jgi:Tetracyclin repressor-like, C-terminal domain
VSLNLWEAKSDGVGDSDDVAAYVRALSLAFVTFALDHPGHFRLMFRNDLVNRNDPRYPEISMKPGMRLGLAVAAYRGKSDVDLNRFGDAADILCGGLRCTGSLIWCWKRKLPNYRRLYFLNDTRSSVSR